MKQLSPKTDHNRETFLLYLAKEKILVSSKLRQTNRDAQFAIYEEKKIIPVQYKRDLDKDIAIKMIYSNPKQMGLCGDKVVFIDHQTPPLNKYSWQQFFFKLALSFCYTLYNICPVQSVLYLPGNIYSLVQTLNISHKGYQIPDYL